MNFFSENNLTRWIVILPIVSIIITAFLFAVSGITSRKAQLERDTNLAQIKLIKQHKKDAQKRVYNIVSYIKNSEKILKEEAKETVKNTVNLAMTMIDITYKSHKDLPKKEIITKVKNRLRNIRFWNGTGYFFIYDLDANCLLLPPRTYLENTNLMNLQDAKGKFTVADLLKIIKDKDEGFEEWWWYKPNEKVMKKKIGFVKVFKPLNIFIGTARYEEDIMTQIKQSMTNSFFKNFLVNDKEYFFIYDEEGNSVMQENNKMNEEEVSVIIKGSKYSSDGFFLNHTISPNYSIEKELKSGSSFVNYIPELKWIVGTSIFKDEILEDILLNKQKMEKRFSDLVSNRILFSFGLLIVILIIASFFSSQLKKVLKTYKKDLLEKNNETLKQKELLKFNLKHDHLTSLPNRALLTDRLNQIIKHSIRDKKQAAVMFIDIDKFKIINDTSGHDVGDELLQEVALRLSNAMRDSDTVARFGGDEFVILIDRFKNIHDIITVIEKIQNKFKNLIIIKNITYKISFSIGISVFPNDGDNIQSLLKNADMAMYKAKSEGGDRYRFFTSKMNEEIQKQIDTEKALRIAAKNKEFVLHYQPLVQAKNNDIVGVEALLRWNHPIKGLVFPDEFIEVAEESSVIIEMGEWILYESMRQMSEWKAKGYGIKKISINVATKQLEHEDFIDYMKKTLKNTSCKAQWIEVEIVERYAMKNVNKSIEVLNELRQMDIDIAIDDFGTGHSSLAYLKKLPITKLKIDRAFVKNITNSYEDRAIAKSILALGSGLHLKVLAEGVEKEGEREFFTFNGCDEMQGYLFSKPLPVDEVEKLLKKGSI